VSRTDEAVKILAALGLPRVLLPQPHRGCGS
jgi:hypothetical protein